MYDLETEIKAAIHNIVANLFDKIEDQTAVQVEEICIENFSVNISLRIQPREESEN